MSADFFVTPARRLHIVVGVGFLSLAVFVPLLFALGGETLDAEGRVFMWCFIAFCVAVAVWRFWLARREPPGSFATTLPERLDRHEQIAHYRRMLWISVLSFSAASIWIFYDLFRLEMGTAARVSLWRPVGWLYESVGFLPAALVAPLLGLFCIGVFWTKLRRLTRDA